MEIRIEMSQYARDARGGGQRGGQGGARPRVLLGSTETEGVLPNLLAWADTFT